MSLVGVSLARLTTRKLKVTRVMPPTYLSSRVRSSSGHTTKSITRHAGNMKAVKPIVEAIAPNFVAHLAHANSKHPVHRKAYATSLIS